MMRRLLIVSLMFGFGCGQGTAANGGGKGGGGAAGGGGAVGDAVGGGGGGGGGAGGGAYSGTDSQALRFGATRGSEGLVSADPVNANKRTIAGWYRIRSSVATEDRQLTAWALQLPAPSSSYQLLDTAWHADEWALGDSAQGGFLFAPVDQGWWFVAETNDAMAASGPETRLYFKKEGDPTLTMKSGNHHPVLDGVTRFVIGIDDAASSGWMDGDIAGVKIWDVALSQEELEAEAQQLSPRRTADLHAFYPLQAPETMLHDASGHHRDLTGLSGTGSWSVQTGPAIVW